MATTRITKTMAAAVAKQMALDTIGKKRDAVRKELISFGNLLRKKYHAINPDVEKAYKALPDYFRTETSIYIVADGLKWLSLYQLEPYPVKSNNQTAVEVPREDYEKCFTLKSKIEKLDSELRVFCIKVETTLLALRNLKRVEQDFPEAFAYFDEEEKVITAVTLPIDELRNTIAQYLTV